MTWIRIVSSKAVGRRLRFLMAIMVLSAPSLQGVAACPLGQTEVSAERVAKAIGSRNEKRASWAVHEVMRRGPSMIPYLLKNKSDRRPFMGSGLGNPNGAQLIILPSQKPKINKGEIITVEVASLYLISSLYYGTLEFAQSPYLTDLSAPPEKRRALNTRELVERAWVATERWAASLRIEDIDLRRQNKQSPLEDSQVDFW